MQYLLAFLVFYGPFALVLLDVLITRDARPSRKLLGYATAALGVVPLVLLFRSGSYVWWILLPAQLAVIYARRMQGLPKYIICFAGFSFLCAAFSTAGPNIGHPSFRYYEMLALPMFVTLWVNSPLTVWLLWRDLPVAVDALRGGNWAKTGVPLQVRHGLLALIVLVSLAGNIALYYLLSDYRTRVGSTASNSLNGMYCSLNDVERRLTYRDSPSFTGWQTVALQDMADYSKEASIVRGLVNSGGVCTTSGMYFLTEGFPQGLTGVLQRGEELSAEDMVQLLAIVGATKDAVEQVRSKRGMSVKLYERAVSDLIERLGGTEALGILNLQYVPRPYLFPGR